MSNMNSILYVYDMAGLSALRTKFDDYKFYSIAYFFQMSDALNNISTLDLGRFKKSIVDLTNLVKDNNFYRIFSERYILTLCSRVEEIHFCINYDLLEKLTEQFPYLFDNEHINYEFQKNTEKEMSSPKPLSVNMADALILNTYISAEKIKERYKAGEIISLSNLIDECEGIFFRYNIDNIRKILESQNVKYVDLSSAMRMFKLRPDLIFQFEILIQQISLNGNIQYCIEQSLIADVTALFPFWSIEKEPIDEGDEGIDKTVLQEEPLQIDVGEISLLAQNICGKLRGHDEFKKDFRKNLLKFFFLNRMGEQKILSIMLCGNSGIGKTQFAKFMSETMFPGEPLIKINFGNYSTEGVLNSLIGSHLGYVGSEEGGELISKITTSKTKIILIDEFEKATPSVYNFFYELLEDGIFTDRHGIEHNLDGYIVVFTSNMTRSEYSKKIPDSLKSRFDIVYYFVDLSVEEKQQYIQATALQLIEKLEKSFGKKVNVQDISSELSELSQYNNLRNIKKAVEDRVFNAFLDVYVNEKKKKKVKGIAHNTAIPFLFLFDYR